MTTQQLALWEGSSEPAGSWQTLYARVRRDGVRVSVAIPPKGAVVLIGVGDRRVAIERDELAHVEAALRAAREGEG